MSLSSRLRELLGDPNPDQDVELYSLFSQPLISPLGGLDPTASTLSLTVGSYSLTVHQSPGILTSSRSEGTTGSILWAVTPHVAEWLLDETCILRTLGALSESSVVLELGCGISGVLATTVGRRARDWVCADLAYVMKGLRQNLRENLSSERQRRPPTGGSAGSSKQRAGGGVRRAKAKEQGLGEVEHRDEERIGNVTMLELDWTLHSLDTPSLPVGSLLRDVNVVIACDCIYNPALIEPFVQTCRDACRLRGSDNEDEIGDRESTICIVAQQLRSSEVFEEWLREFIQWFDVWRIDDEKLVAELRSDRGFCVHVGIVKDKKIRTGRAATR